MEIRFTEPDLKAKREKELNKHIDNDKEQYYCLAMLEALGCRTWLPRRVSTRNHEDACSEIDECCRNRDYADVPALVDDLREHYEAVCEQATAFAEALRRKGYQVCPICGDIEKVEDGVMECCQCDPYTGEDA